MAQNLWEENVLKTNYFCLNNFNNRRTDMARNLWEEKTGSLGREMGRGMRERVRRLERPLPSLPASEVGVVTVFVP
jgi:hypothetical protein